MVAAQSLRSVIGERNMEYKLNLGAWNSVFAVPGDIVDKHLRLAGAAQLKVILWTLRHAGEAFTIDDISSALYMSAADVRDSMLYWKETGIICENDGVFEPSQAESSSAAELPSAPAAKAASVPETAAVPQPEPAPEPVQENRPEDKKPSRVLSRPEKPDIKYLTERMNSDEGVLFLMQTADEIFGRPTSNNEKETLLLIHEYDGIPVEVLVMLLQYACGIGKNNIRYIEKMAINWADEEITTLERAEEKIRRLTSGRSAAGIVQGLFGIDPHSPTEKEIKLADSWLNEWKLSPELVRYAYEICVDAKGKYIAGYVNKVLERWHSAGISTMEQARADQSSSKKTSPKKNNATYDIDRFESTNAIIEEGF